MLLNKPSLLTIVLSVGMWMEMENACASAELSERFFDHCAEAASPIVRPVIIHCAEVTGLCTCLNLYKTQRALKIMEINYDDWTLLARTTCHIFLLRAPKSSLAAILLKFTQTIRLLREFITAILK